MPFTALGGIVRGCNCDRDVPSVPVSVLNGTNSLRGVDHGTPWGTVPPQALKTQGAIGCSQGVTRAYTMLDKSSMHLCSWKNTPAPSQKSSAVPPTFNFINPSKIELS